MLIHWCCNTFEVVGADLGASHGDGEGSAIPKRHEVGLHPLRPMLHPIVSAEAVLHPHSHPAQAQMLGLGVANYFAEDQQDGTTYCSWLM